MIAAAIVCAAAMSQAAALAWGTYGWAGDANPDLGDWITGGKAYLVMVTDAATFAVADDLSVTGGSIVDSMAFADGTANGTWNDTSDLVAGQTYQFAMILTTAGSDKVDDKIVIPTSGMYGLDDNDSALYEVTWNASTGGDITPVHDGVFMDTAVAPEPTSGLLLLLGVAGLALRRRRA